MPLTLPGTGEEVRTDVVSGEHVEEVKIVFGAAGAAVGVESDVGLPVTLPDALDASVGDSILAMPTPGTAAQFDITSDFTTSVTGEALATPSSGFRYVATQLFIEWSGANDGSIFVWGPAASAADTAYTAETDKLLAQAHPTPSTKGNGGIIRNGQWVGAGNAYPIRVTTTGNLVCTVSVQGYYKAV